MWANALQKMAIMREKYYSPTRKPGQPDPPRKTARGQPNRQPNPAQPTGANPGPINQTGANPPPNPANGAKPGQPTDPGPTPDRSNNPPQSIPPDQITGANNRGKPTRPNQPNRANQRPANGPTDQTQPNPRKMQTTPQTGRIVKCALTNLAKPKKPRFARGRFGFTSIPNSRKHQIVGSTRGHQPGQTTRPTRSFATT